MATLSSISQSLHVKKSSVQELKAKKQLLPRSSISVSCRSRLRAESSAKEGKEEEKAKKQLFPELISSFRQVLKEGLSPKRKGDWKDLVLMSLSFAVYVYMSQKIVCAYCAWMSILKQS